MQEPRIIASSILMLLAANPLGLTHQRAGAQESRTPAAAVNPDLNQADQMAWEIFVDINKPANNGTQDVVWETWADDGYQFPAKPDPAKPPTWPPPRQAKVLRNSSPTLELALKAMPRLSTSDIHTFILTNGLDEEVRRNKPTFDYIISNKLWYSEGIAEFAKSGRDVETPADSLMVKAHWKVIAEGDKPRYHWNTAVDPRDQKLKPFGLIALHLSSKRFPNWLWATFEHVDNPNRGADLGYHDSFGVSPPNTNGTVSDALRQLFKQNGLGDEWSNYRLDGSQIDFHDGTGKETLLGNSEIEGRLGPNLMKSSSCLSCHARIGASIATGVETGDVSFVTGTPPAALFYGPDGKRKNIQMDFIWGFGLAQPALASEPLRFRP